MSRLDQADVIDDGAEVRKQFAEPDPVLAVAVELERVKALIEADAKARAEG